MYVMNWQSGNDVAMWRWNFNTTDFQEINPNLKLFFEESVISDHAIGVFDSILICQNHGTSLIQNYIQL